MTPRPHCPRSLPADIPVETNRLRELTYELRRKVDRLDRLIARQARKDAIERFIEKLNER